MKARVQPNKGEGHAQAMKLETILDINMLAEMLQRMQPLRNAFAHTELKSERPLPRKFQE